MEFGREAMTIEVSSIVRNKLAGICGASNLNIKSGETNGFENCRYSKASLEVASNRIESGSCPQLEQPIKEELEKEKGQCAKVKVTLTKVRFILLLQSSIR